MIDLNQQPYFDDYNKDGEGNNSFLRILFRPGYPVQARELTQIQSIVQGQIERFGQHFFKDGSKVSGGDLVLNRVQYLKLTDLGDWTLDDFDGVELSASSGVKAKVVSLTEHPNDTPDDARTIYIQYITDGTFNRASQINVVGTTQSFTVADQDDYTGTSLLASVNSGVFYVKGFFVHTPDQTILVERIANPSARIGLEVNDYIVTESEDPSLLDPAFGSYNFNAPGAHRLAIDLSLTTRLYTEINEVDVNFVELIRIKDGEIETEIRNPTYNEFEDQLARRTFDESGSYTVRPFQISFEANDDDTKVNVILDAGKAYVEGYEFETINKSTLVIDKARDTEFYNNSDSFIRYGQYYVSNNIYGGAFNVATLEQVALYDDQAVQIGSARVKAVYTQGIGQYQIYLMDIQVSNSDHVRTIVAPSGAVATVDISGGTTELLRGADSILVSPFFPENPKLGSIADVNYQTQRQFSGILDSGKRITLSTASPSERFVGSGVYTGADLFIKQNYIFLIDGVETEPVSVDIPSVGNTEVGRMIASFIGGTAVQIIARIEVNNSSPKAKIRRSATETLVVGSAAWVDLQNADIILNSVLVEQSFNDVTQQFEFDDGQRSEFYSFGRVRKLTGDPVEVVVTYDYFEHSGVGYFNVDSYSGVSYEDIPSYKHNGVVYDLKSCFDFRPNLTTTPTSQIPANNTSISFDYEYYVPRYDRIVATKSKEFAVVRGTPKLNPSVPEEPEGTMTLYVLRISPYTVTQNDIGVKFVENRRYTMRDIGKLERRIENLEYYTSLSMLETKTATLNVEGRFRNGFLVDSFKNYDVSDTTQFGFECYVDTNREACGVSFVPNEFELELQTLPPQYVTTADGMITRKYTEKTFVNQKVITGFINVNPFNVFTWIGRAKLTPEVDNWIEEKRLPNIVSTINTDNVPYGWRPTSTVVSDVVTDRIWLNSYPTSSARNWDERNRLMQQFVDKYNIPSIGITSLSSAMYVGIANIRRQVVETTGVTERTVTVSDTDAVVAQTAIPYMRQKDVTIDVEGLLPNKRYYFRFDGVDVNANTMPLANGSIPSGSFGQAVMSNGQGKLRALFRIPGGTFKTGARILRISDHISHNPDVEVSNAIATYTAEGFLVTRQRTVILNRIREVTTSRSTRNVVSFEWYDPLAQTFLVDSNTYPDGMFLSSVDLYFVEKDDNLPVTVAIRPTVNGYPSSNDTYAFASKTLQPNNVIVNSLANASLKGYGGSSFVATKFKFDTPIFLTPGEHSFVVMANTNKYRVAMATIGKQIYNTNSVMTENPYNGVMFISQNASTWTADQYSDLCFNLNRASFDTVAAQPVTWKVKYVEPVEYDAFAVNTSVTSFANTGVAFETKTRRLSDGQYETNKVETNVTVAAPNRRVILSADDVELKMNIDATEVLAPMVDTEQTFFVTTTNYVNNDSTDEELPYHGNANGRYIHKAVTLTDDYIATELRVWMDANVPMGANIKVYVKYQNTTNDSTPFADIGWEEAQLFSTSGVEREYRLQVASGFNAYQTKVVLLASDTTKPPSFTNFRVVTFQE